MGAPVSAGFIAEYCNADDFTNALVDYCNHHEIRNMTGYDLDIDNYNCRIFDVSSDGFRFECRGLLVMYILIPPPFPCPYHFTGTMRWKRGVTKLEKPYTLKPLPETPLNRHRKGCGGFVASAPNWVLAVKNDYLTRFDCV